jgi:hypothetical protein
MYKGILDKKYAILRMLVCVAIFSCVFIFLFNDLSGRLSDLSMKQLVLSSDYFTYDAYSNGEIPFAEAVLKDYDFGKAQNVDEFVAMHIKVWSKIYTKSNFVLFNLIMCGMLYFVTLVFSIYSMINYKPRVRSEASRYYGVYGEEGY